MVYKTNNKQGNFTVDLFPSINRRLTCQFILTKFSTLLVLLILTPYDDR